jgi:hypothetical protein
MLGSKIIQLLKAIPLLLWGALVWAFNAGPAEVTSKTAAWGRFFGYPDLPAYIATKSTDRYVLIAAGIIAALYILGVWVWPWWRSRHPRLIPLQEAALRGFEKAERLGLEDTISKKVDGNRVYQITSGGAGETATTRQSSSRVA